jgi:L-ribulokinase
MAKDSYVIGVDYGTDSVRSVIVDAKKGREISSAVHYYSRWKAGKFCDPSKNQFRQHPLDYLEGLEITIREAIKKAPKGVAACVKGISVDTTGSTPVAVDKNGTPLSLTKEFAENPNAMFILWKDHTAVREAAEINEKAGNWGGENYTRFEGGIYSSEWFFAKILHVLREDKKVRAKAFSWVEHCDWIPAVLAGCTDALSIKRSRCAAGHKAMWHPLFKGLPPEKFLVKLDPLLKGLRERLFEETYTSDVKFGNLCPEWAKKLALPGDVAIGVGAFDAHMGAVGGEIEPYILSKVMGTSTCDMLVAPNAAIGKKLIRGICGQVDGSVMPGMLGMEAGQSAFGDVYAWFAKMITSQVEAALSGSRAISAKTRLVIAEELSKNLIPSLTLAAEKIPIGESGITALDWLNGRRTPDANQALTGAITGLSLGSDAPKIFRALVEATAFGAKKIVDRFISEGVPIKGVIALGGVAKKSPFVMQIVADVLNMKIRVARSEQACALGAAMFAAVASDIYPDVTKAQKAMGQGFEKEYKPVAENAKKYKALYDSYSKLAAFVEKESSDIN